MKLIIIRLSREMGALRWLKRCVIFLWVLSIVIHLELEENRESFSAFFCNKIIILVCIIDEVDYSPRMKSLQAWNFPHVNHASACAKSCGAMISTILIRIWYYNVKILEIQAKYKQEETWKCSFQPIMPGLGFYLSLNFLCWQWLL